MESISKLSDFQNRVYLDRISKAVRDLSSTITDTQLFVQQMVSLSTLLVSLDRKLDKSYPTIDKNTQDPTYFIAAYFDTRNVTEALLVYRIVRCLTRFILLSDRFYETGNEKYALLAKQVRESLNEFLQSGFNLQHLIYSIDYWLGQFSAFWKFEQTMKNRMINNFTFSFNEIRHFNLSKSSDALLVYSKVLGAVLPSFNENVALALHYNQALLDILDDWEDIENDIRGDMPNIFVMAAVNYIPYCKIKKSSHGMIRQIVLSRTTSSPKGPIGRLICELHDSSKGVSVPNSFALLKTLSGRYTDTLRRTIFTTNSR
jgi:hypothetical protein